MSPARLAGPLRHTAAEHPGRFGLMLGVVGVAVVVGGGLGVLLAILALMLLIDAALPIPGRARSEADDHFWRLVRARQAAAQARRLRGRPPERLDVVDDGGARRRRALGVQAIALDSITGTVESAKAREFDGRFRPDRGAHERWCGVWLVCARGGELPPVSVYRVDGRHVVRDGHHRISVARDQGWTTIEADVTELR